MQERTVFSGADFWGGGGGGGGGGRVVRGGGGFWSNPLNKKNANVKTGLEVFPPAQFEFAFIVGPSLNRETLQLSKKLCEISA